MNFPERVSQPILLALETKPPMLDALLPTGPAAWLAHAVPLLFLVAAGAAALPAVPTGSAWRLARFACVANVGLAVATLTATLAGAGSDGWTSPAWASAGALVLLLFAFLGRVLTGYAETYLAGEPGQRRFVVRLCATLAGSSLVAATGHFGVLVVAWLGTSLALQGLLTFYGDRPAAQMAAHKKFLVSRAADLCMVGACLLLHGSAGTLRIGELLAAPLVAVEVQLALLLVAAAVLLKSAQLPFHGWLMQVMEAPTPVSALLHAGVVNLGGLVLVRLAPLVAEAPAAQVLLVVAGSVTAVVAALVAETRISIKVALAWSTCAQMGFMVLQCGLGLFEMALLHLLAHSLYKAWAFLGAGSVVQQQTARAMAPAQLAPSAKERALAFVIALVAVVAVGTAFGAELSTTPALFAMAFVATLALSSLLAARSSAPDWRWRARGAVAAAGVAVTWFLLHALLHAWLLPPLVAEGPLPVALAGWVVLAFTSLFVVRSCIALRPESPLAKRLFAWCYGGLFLDEGFTRLTLRVWPVGRRPLNTSNLVQSRGLSR